MRMLDTVRRALRLGEPRATTLTPAQVQRTVGPEVWDAISNMVRGAGGTISAKMNLAGLDRPAENFVWIYLGMMARAESIAQVPMRISTAGDQMVDGGDLWNLIERPNSRMDRVQYLMLLESYLALYNQAVVLMTGTSSESPATRPEELIPLNPACLRPILAVHERSGVRMVAAWDYREPGGTDMRVWPEDCIVIESLNPHAPYGPLSPFAAGRRTIQADMAAREQNLAIFANGGMTDIVFEADQPWTRDQVDEFMAVWQDRYGGLTNAHKPGFLYGGIKAKGLGLSPTDLQFLEGMRLTRQEQIALMRVKPAMVGLMEGETGLSQGSSTAEQKVAWWNETGLFELARIAQAHQTYLVDRFSWGSNRTGRELNRLQRVTRAAHQSRAGRATVHGGSALHVWFDEGQIEELVQHRLGKLDQFTKLLEWGYEPDAASEFLDLRLPPHPANMGTMPFARQPVGDLRGNDEGGTRNDGPEPRGAEAPWAQGRLARIEAGIRGMAERREAAQREELEKNDRRRNGWQAFLRPYLNAASRKWGRFYIEQRKRVSDRLAELGATVTRADEAPVPPNLLELIFPKGEEDKLLVARLTPLWADTIEAGWDLLRGQADALSAFEVEDPRTVAALEKWTIQGTKVNETTEEALRGILRKGVTDGLTLDELADAIDGYYRDNANGEKSWRAMTAARTQTAGLVNSGQMMAARDVGGLKKAWLHGDPKDPRQAHVAAEGGEPIGLDEKFVINGVRLDHPGDPEADVSETANCTCSLVFVPAEVDA